MRGSSRPSRPVRGLGTSVGVLGYAEPSWSRRAFEVGRRALLGLATLVGILAFALLGASVVPVALALLYVSSTLARLVWGVAGIVPPRWSSSEPGLL